MQPKSLRRLLEYGNGYILHRYYKKIGSLPFWKREKEWKKIKDEVEKDVVSVIEAKIKQVYGR